jgi:hypothetical protein
VPSVASVLLRAAPNSPMRAAHLHFPINELGSRFAIYPTIGRSYMEPQSIDELQAALSLARYWDYEAANDPNVSPEQRRNIKQASHKAWCTLEAAKLARRIPRVAT